MGPVKDLLDSTIRIFVGKKRDPQRSASYKAVTVASTAHCCAAARDTKEKPLLVSGLPRLPLPGCSMPATCRCQFREWPDRRIGERRLQSRSGGERRRK